MNRFISRAALVAALALPVAATIGCAPMNTVGSNALTQDGRKPVILHVTNGNPGYWNQALNNAANLQAALGADKVHVEVVVNGPAIKMLTVDSTVQVRVAGAVANGVKIVACENTMKALKISRDDMLPGVSFVPAGIVEVLERQRDGWAYVNY